MKNILLDLILQTVNLLNNCGWYDKADFFSDIYGKLEQVQPGAEEFQKQLKVLSSILCGMGSFSDLPLKSKTGKITEAEARKLQWNLAVKIDEAIESLKEVNDGL